MKNVRIHPAMPPRHAVMSSPCALVQDQHMQPKPKGRMGEHCVAYAVQGCTPVCIGSCRCDRTWDPELDGRRVWLLGVLPAASFVPASRSTLEPYNTNTEFTGGKKPLPFSVLHPSRPLHCASEGSAWLEVYGATVQVRRGCGVPHACAGPPGRPASAQRPRGCAPARAHPSGTCAAAPAHGVSVWHLTLLLPQDTHLLAAFLTQRQS